MMMMVLPLVKTNMMEHKVNTRKKQYNFGSYFGYTKGIASVIR